MASEQIVCDIISLKCRRARCQDKGHVQIHTFWVCAPPLQDFKHPVRISSFTLAAHPSALGILLFPPESEWSRMVKQTKATHYTLIVEKVLRHHSFPMMHLAGPICLPHHVASHNQTPVFHRLRTNYVTVATFKTNPLVPSSGVFPQCCDCPRINPCDQ